jgi:hypothetical protein
MGAEAVAVEVATEQWLGEEEAVELDCGRTVEREREKVASHLLCHFGGGWGKMTPTDVWGRLAVAPTDRGHFW